MELRFYHTKSQWSSELYLNSISSQPQHPDSPRPFLTAARPPPTTPPPHHEAFLFVQCSLSPTSTLITYKLLIKSYTTTMSSINLHNAKKMIFLIVRSLRLYFYAMPATTG